MRYSSSLVVAIIFAFFTFLGMAYLITTPRMNTSTYIEMVDFTKIRDMKTPDNTQPIKKHVKPEQKIVKQPPVAPSIDVPDSMTREGIKLPTGTAKIKNIELTELTMNKIGIPGGDLKSDGDLMQMFSIAPIYPDEALRNKIEGWIKVEFVVNELGRVGKIKIIDSKPKGVFKNATIRALKKSKFKPLMVDGKAMSQTAVQVIEFKLEN